MPFVYCSLWSTDHPSFPFSVFPPPTHTRLPCTHTRSLPPKCASDARVFSPSPSTGSFMTTVAEICWSHLQRASVTPSPPFFVTLGKSAKSKCGVNPACVFNVPLLLSPMTRGGPPRVLALSPGVLSLLYLSTRHGRSPKDNHTCMLKKAPPPYYHHLLVVFFKFISAPTEKIRLNSPPHSHCFSRHLACLHHARWIPLSSNQKFI